MIGAIICFIIVLLAIESGQWDMVVIFGIIGVICFNCRSKEDPDANFISEAESKKREKERKEKQKNMDLSVYRATPSLVQKYLNHPITTEVVQQVLTNGAYEGFSFQKNGYILSSYRISGGTERYYSYDFRAHQYKAPTLAEQEAILIAITRKLPYGNTYTISYTHREDDVIPQYFLMSTDQYKNSRWDETTQQWRTLRSH